MFPCNSRDAPQADISVNCAYRHSLPYAKKKFLGSFENCLLSEKRLKVLKSSVVLMIEKCFINIHDAAQMDVCIASQRYYFPKSCSRAMSIAEILISLFSSYEL